MRAYLAGPINGCTDEEARGWREELKMRLAGSGIEWLDPMVRDYRGKEDQSVDAIVHGDVADMRDSDVIVVNASRPSWGTAMEVVYARQLGKRILVWCPGSVSPWLRFHATEVVSSIYELESRLGHLAAVAA